jgi:hypothetical protein
MEVIYGLRIMLMEREPLLFLVFQYQFKDKPSMIKNDYIDAYKRR